MPSAPVAVGVIQVPPSGRPIVLLRDGPTVGGYPRLAILDPPAISRFTQCAPGTGVRFVVGRVMDINCDLGEGEPLAKTRRMLRWVTSANIACGGHAGNERTMRACLKLCQSLRVNAGAHPGFEDRRNFGRTEQEISPAEIAGIDRVSGRQAGVPGRGR